MLGEPTDTATAPKMAIITMTDDKNHTLEAAALHKLTAWLSPGYPVGAFAFSHGLEQAVAAGEIVDAATATDWIAACLRHGSGRNVAILLAHAWKATDQEGVVEINELACALAASSERHLETTMQGTAFMRTTGAVWDSGKNPLAYPVAVGSEARRHSIGLAPTLSLFLHAFVANLVSACIRLVPLGQTEGQQVTAGLFNAMDEVAAEAAETPLDDIGGCAFRSDLASMKHETKYSRLFRS